MRGRPSAAAFAPSCLRGREGTVSCAFEKSRVRAYRACTYAMIPTSCSLASVRTVALGCGLRPTTARHRAADLKRRLVLAVRPRPRDDDHAPRVPLVASRPSRSFRAVANRASDE